jgi:hypothetical protein
MHNLTAIYWIKNESRYLPEYIEFHLLQGFDHFIFYDNKSDDRTLEVLKPYMDDGLVEVRYYPKEIDMSGISKNYWLMSHCIDEQKYKTKWLHFHAIDEYMFCKNNKKITDFLKDYEQYGGVAVNWKLFNSNNHIQRPEGLTIENFKQALKVDVNLHVKTIIQPLKTRSPAPNTHCFYTNLTVDENFHQVTGPFNTVIPSGFTYPNTKTQEERKFYTFNKIQINHYVSRSKQQWDESNSKGLLDHGKASETRAREREDLWISLHPKEEAELENLNDTDIFINEVKKNIKNKYNNNQDILDIINH